MSIITPDDLVYYTDKNNNVYSGGYSIQSALLKNKISPIMTLNNGTISGGNGSGSGNGSVSDIFKDLVVPNWALYAPHLNSHSDPLKGGRENISDTNTDDNSDTDEMNNNKNNKKLKNKKTETGDEADNSNKEIDNTLYDKLLNLATVIDNKVDKELSSMTKYINNNNNNNNNNKRKTKKKAKHILDADTTNTTLTNMQTKNKSTKSPSITTNKKLTKKHKLKS